MEGGAEEAEEDEEEAGEDVGAAGCLRRAPFLFFAPPPFVPFLPPPLSGWQCGRTRAGKACVWSANRKKKDKGNEISNFKGDFRIYVWV